MAYIHSTNYKHNQAVDTDIAVLLVNLGTPDAPTPAAVRRYLAEFLSDPRVIEIPSFVWKPILHGIILRVRPKASAKRYASIWTEQGSPLMVWTQTQAAQVQARLDEQGHKIKVAYAMRYGNPSIASVMQQLQSQGVTRILVLPLYPQYAGSSTATAIDEVNRYVASVRCQPELRFIKHFHDDTRYIQAMVKRIQGYWAEHGRGEKLVLSFHGVPKQTLLKGDPYHCECLKTGRLLKEALGLTDDQLVITFQSRFGKAEWLQPYTEPTVVKLAQSGVKRLDIFCPGFVSECLETVEEIADEVKQAFVQAGGQGFHYIPALNDLPQWLDAMTDIVTQHLQGWVPIDASQQLALAQARAQRANALGADN